VYCAELFGKMRGIFIFIFNFFFFMARYVSYQYSRPVRCAMFLMYLCS
jgi:hypothetical protein